MSNPIAGINEVDLTAIETEDWPLLAAFACYGMGLGQTRLFSIVHDAQAPSDIHFDIESLKNGMARLMVKKVIKSAAIQGFEIDSAWLWPVLLHLKHAGTLQTWLNVTRKHQPTIQPWESGSQRAWAHRALQAVLSDDVHACGQALYQMSTVGMSPEALLRHPAYQLFQPQAKNLFELASAQTQTALLTDYLHYAYSGLLPASAQYNYARAHFNDRFQQSPELAEYLCWQAIFRGDLAHIQLFYQAMEVEPQAEIAIVLAAIQGNHNKCFRIGQELIAGIKKITNKRKVAIGGLGGVFFSAALFAEPNNGEYLAALLTQFEAGDKARYSAIYDIHLPWVKQLATQIPASPQVHHLPPAALGLHGFFDLLLLFWQEQELDAQWQAPLEQLLAQWQEYPWVHEELAQLLDRAYGTNWATPDWHSERQLKPLIDLVKLEPVWQRALSALSQFNKAPSAASAASIRLAWQLTAGAGGVLLEPREQKISAKGVWSKGRAVALKRLMQGDPTLTYLSEQDRKICRYIAVDYNYYGDSGYTLDGEAALPDLINHPHVYWSDAPDIRIDIVAGEVTLHLKESAGKISLKLAPHITQGANVIWQKETPTRLAVYQVTPDVTQIAGILGKGLTVPSEAKPQLVEAITAIAPHITIHSDLPELSAHIDSIAANPVIFAHLLPIETGLRLQFLVRPLAESGWFIPGKGAANVLGELDGKTVQAQRDLAAEKAAHQHVLNYCTALADAERDMKDGNDWQLGSPELSLELLAQLRDMPAGIVELVWPEGERFRLKGSRTMGQMKLGIKQQGDWFVVNGEITLDDGKVLQLRQLLSLLDDAPGRFISLGEHDYLALTDNLRRRLEELRALGEPNGSDGIKLNLLASSALADLASEAGEVETDRAWQAHLAKLDSLAQHQPKVPSTLQATLRDYQLEGFQWLSRLAHWGVGACLADDMGLGKTVQTLALLLERAPNGPALVVAPTSVAINWQAETAKFAPTLNIRNFQSDRNLSDLSPFDLVVVSYGLFQQEAESFANVHWHTVVLDEAQAIKNSQTRRSQSAMALNADFKMIATGTPMENHLGELWNLFRFINPALLGSQERFKKRFAQPIEDGQSDAKHAKLALRKLIQPFMLRRTKSQVLTELPARTEITHKVALSSEELHLYEALRQQAVERIDSMRPDEGNKPLQVLTEITKLRRFCCNPRLVMKDSQLAGSKLIAFAEIAEELLDNNHKALVFSQFVDHLAIVRDWLDSKGISYQYLDGSTPIKQRQKAVNDFQAGVGDIFLISLKAGGSGLNLTAADYVIHLDPWWNPAVEDQASDRAHRMGQQRPVTIYRLVAEGTIEEQIVALHHNKRDLADSLLEGGDASGKLDADALLNLLKTSR
ncbi:DEAD/DEAH box helicase [Chitinibacter bivalviorum]|uniref:DEAD/DEAH box helicase n=1 Tax=Chitinibacter bivalviorum TaxID=2739434 RepID=A0A7H9BFR7_9NEIS|nr:DEAD/DEAH box helicase [Chitinibacter bivalviorum]QLG87469.1 DEAD/DEAH box helicase [Chitinibacter bivalviorum]